MPARTKTAVQILTEKGVFDRARESKPAEKPQEAPSPPAYFNEPQATAWRDICKPLCEARAWKDALALWAESFALLLAEAREQGETKPNRAQLRLYCNDLRQLVGDAAPAEPNPFDEF